MKVTLDREGQPARLEDVQQPVADSPVSGGEPAATTPAAPLEPVPLPELERFFTVDGVEMIVRNTGGAAGGTGRLGLAAFEALRFYAASAPDRPLREALMPAGQLPGLYDDELRALWKRATVLDTAG